MIPTCDLWDTYRDTLEVLPATLRSYGGAARFHGPVETVTCFEDNSRIKDLSKEPGNGRVLVVDAGGSLRAAVLGDIIGGALADQGWAGIVIWGAIRDVEALAHLPFGVLALGHLPRPGTRRDGGQIGLPVTIGEARVSPGDYIVVDADGGVVFAKDGPRPEGATA